VIYLFNCLLVYLQRLVEKLEIQYGPPIMKWMVIMYADCWLGFCCLLFDNECWLLVISKWGNDGLKPGVIYCSLAP
jgi:hypothetical protein